MSSVRRLPLSRNRPAHAQLIRACPAARLGRTSPGLRGERHAKELRGWDPAARASSIRSIEIVADPTANCGADAQLLQQAFGLTAAEARILVEVGSGRSVPQVAADLEIAITTARTHLQRCFDKTGVHSQAGLARLLAAFPLASGLARKLDS